jgi:hypothetical protein
MSRVNIPGVGLVDFPATMSDDDIAKAIQTNILPSLKTAPAPTDKPADFSAKETALALGQGIVGAGKSIADVFGAENVASQALGKVQTTLGEQFSPERKAEMARREAIQKKAAESGSLTEEISAFLGSVADAPVQSLAQGLGSIVPYVGTGIIGAIAKLGGPTVMAINTALGAAQGAGAVKGSIYDSVRNELINTGMDPKEADAKAAKAQEYLGGNLLDIAGGAALGGAGARFGVEKLLTPGAASKLDAGLLSRMGKAALAEAPLEGAQAYQEQVAVNRALQQAGFDVSTFKGAAGAAARDAAIGALTGAAVGSVRGPGTPTAPLTEEEQTVTPPPPAPPVTPPGGVPPEALDLETLLSVATPAAEDTADIEIPKASGKPVDELAADNARIQAGLDAGKYANPIAAAAAKARIDRQQAEIDAQAAAPIVTPEVIAEQAAAPVKESIYEVPKKEAGDYVAAIESQTVKPNASILKKHVKALGIEVPPGPGFNERAISAIKTQVVGGEQDVTQQTDVGAGGVGTEVLGGPPAADTTAGAARDGRPGVVGDQGTKLTPKAGAREQQSTLDPVKSFFDWAAKSGIRLPEDGEVSDFPDLVQRWGTETNQPQDLINELAGVEVIDEQALADRAALERDRVEAEAAEAARLAALDEIAGKNIPQTKTDAVIREEYELSREALANTEVNIPPWDDLTTDEKDIYLGSLETAETEQGVREWMASKGITIESVKSKKELDELKKQYRKEVPPVIPSAKAFDDAGKTLAAYRERTAEENLRPAEQRIVNGYEESRPAYQRALIINLPAWNELSQEAQAAYTAKVKNNTVIEQDAGFDAVAEQLEKEDKGIRGVSREGIRNLRLKGAEEESKARTAEEIARAAAAEESAQGKGEPLSEETRAKLENADINGVLSDLISSAEGFKTLRPEKGDKTYRQAYTALAATRKRASALTFRLISNSLNKLRFTSKVVTDVNSDVIKRLEREGKLAEYDPKTDTFYFTPGGMDEATVLHEIVHAGTVKIIKQFLTDPSKLTKDQREAAEHLQKIYDHSKKRLGGKFKNAYENLYEFISYAMTDNKFQIALSEMQVRPLAKYTAAAMNAWRQLTQAMSKMFGLYDAKAQTEELTAEMYQQVAREYGSMDPDELYQNSILDEIESLDLGPITGPTLLGPGKETDIKVKKQKTVKQARKFLTTFPGYEGNLMLEMSEVFGRILATPKAGIDVAPLAAKAAQPKAPLTEPASVVEKKLREDEAAIPPENSAYSPRNVEAKDIKYFKRLLFTKAGWRQIASKLQYDRYAIKHWEDELSLADKIIREGKNKINNIHEQITLATGRGKNLYNSKVESIYKELNEGILGLSKALGRGTDVALDMAHRILEATHEPERRLVKYLMAVPLSETAKVTFGKESISAADFRDRVFKALDTKSFTEAQAKELRKALEAVVFTIDVNGNRIPNTKYVDPAGRSPVQKTEKDAKGNFVTVGVNPDINNDIYNVTGLSLESNANRLADYENEVKNNPELKKQMDAIITSIKKLHDVTTELNKQANYWSQPVTNRVNFYGWKNYVPLKGVSKANEVDEMLDLDGDAMGREVGDITPSNKGKGKELQEIAYGLDGRISVSDNPVLQSLSDAVRAAGRAGRKDLTQAIKNSVAKGQFNPDGQGLLEGKVLMNVRFEQRSDPNFLKELPRENTIFHYNEDGSIDVIEINDKKKREAIRRTYKDTNSLVNYANNITSFLGQVHTRYNYNFAPLNFVRDALTNAWTLGADMGPKKTAEFIAAISGNVINKGAFGKAAKIAYLYQKNNTKEIQRLAKADSFTKEMVEFIEEGGMVEYIQGLSLKSNYDRLQKEVGSSMVIRNVRQLNKLIDLWTDMFEITSRASAYSIAKKNALEEGLSETAARTKAAAYSKNLANFEQVGEHGRGLGALFMFFRPSATGAVRAIEAALPAFQNIDQVMKGVSPNFTDAEKATYKKNFLKRQKSSRYMLTYLMGLGALSYTMAAMMADEDDLGRNKLMKDDMGQWTRFLRFHTPFSDKPFQIPWGFGLGSFMASGAQMAAVAAGHQSIGSALGNVATQISLDSFVPIPFSRMKIEDNPAMFMLDSITPSMLRPAFQFVINKNGLGQDIYNDSNRRMGSAYLGGDNIPQTYKTLATTILDTFGIDVSPNSLYFLTNSYMDGPARIVDLFVNSAYLMADQKEFNAKTDIPFIGSFIGAAPNVDGREFNSITEQVEKMAGRLNMLEKANPDEYLKYLDKNPLHEEIVEFFDKNIGELNKLRKETNEVRIEPGLSPKERTQLIKELNQEQNLIKYDLIQQFKAYYDLKP